MKNLNSGISKLWEVLRQQDGTDARKLLMELTCLLRFSYRWKFSWDKDFIRDCVQEVFVNIWQHRKKLALPHSPLGYLLTSLPSKMASNYPKVWIPINGFSRFDIARESPKDHSLFGPEEIKTQSQLIQKLLTRLSPRQQEAICLRFYQGLSRRKIGSIMGLSQQSASNTLQKTLHSLRKTWPTDLIFFFFLAFLPYLTLCTHFQNIT